MDVTNEMATKNFALGLSEMAQLSPYDRTTLVQCNFELVNGFQLAWAFSKQVMLHTRLLLMNIRDMPKSILLVISRTFRCTFGT